MTGYLGAMFFGPQLFPNVDWTQTLFVIIATYSALGGSISDLMSFGRYIKQKIMIEPKATAKKVRRKKEPNDETGS